MAYVKQGFQDGDILYARNLISIEDALTELESKADTSEASDASLSLRVGTLESAVGAGGSVANQISQAIRAMDVSDSAVAGKYVSQVNVDNSGKLSVTRANLPVTSVNGLTGDVTINVDAIDVMSPPSAQEDGSSGLVPAPHIGDQNKFLRGDATWQAFSVEEATENSAGIMSASDKRKLNSIQNGAQMNTVTGVKGDAEESYRNGTINLTPANIGAAPAQHTHSGADITSGEVSVQRIADLPASKVTSGTFDPERIPLATRNSIGGFILGTGLTMDDGVLSSSSTSVAIVTASQNLSPTNWSEHSNGYYYQDKALPAGTNINLVRDFLADVSLEEASGTYAEKINAWACIGAITVDSSGVRYICYEEIPTITVTVKIRLMQVE